MEYKLAKELKEAGFPQPKEELFGGHYEHKDPDVLNAYCYSPSLSELIEACGEDIKYLFKETPLWYASKHLDTDLSNQGKTPDIAVAKLYIALKVIKKGI